MYGKYSLFYESQKNPGYYAHAQTVSTRPLFGGEWPGDEARDALSYNYGNQRWVNLKLFILTVYNHYHERSNGQSNSTLWADVLQEHCEWVIDLLWDIDYRAFILSKL